MSKFKVGDRVERIADSTTYIKTGEIDEITFVSLSGKYLCLKNHCNFDPLGSYSTDNFKLITTNNTTMKNITEKFTQIFLSEPEKSYRKAGITNGDGLLTDEGQKIFLTWILKKNPSFKEEVVDKLLADEENSK